MDTMIKVSLAEYMALKVMESDFSKVKAVIADTDSRYLDAEVFALLKLLCGGKENKDVSEEH